MSNGVRQGGVLSPYLFPVYLDDLLNELNNIKVGCYIGEALLNHLMFADDIFVFCPSVRWLQRILDVCQAYAESHGIIFNCNKTVCMTFNRLQCLVKRPVLSVFIDLRSAECVCLYYGLRV